MEREECWTPSRLRRMANRYFDSISRRVAVTEQVETVQEGKKVAQERPVINSLGQAAERIEYIEPPTLDGLCGALGIHRGIWAKLSDPKEHPELTDVVLEAQGRIRQYLEQQLLTRKEVRGVLMSLQNSCGWQEREPPEEAEAPEPLTLEQREAILRRAAEDFAREVPDDGGEQG